MNTHKLGSALTCGAAVAVLALTLAACGGGGGGSGPLPSTSTTATPTTTATPGTATGSGVLVDHDTGAPLSGVTIALAADTGGATPVPVATTAANGAFTIHATPGTYLLVIGTTISGTPGPDNRSTIHEMVSLAAGSNTLTAPNVGPPPTPIPTNTLPPGYVQPTWPPTESSGNFRLATLTSAELACFSLENSTRQNNGLPIVASDEWLTEDNRDFWSVATATNSSPQYPAVLTNYNAGDGNGADCSDMISGGFTLHEWFAYPQLVWFDGESGGANHVATAEGMVDPRVQPYPSPTPSKPWP